MPERNLNNDITKSLIEYMPRDTALKAKVILEFCGVNSVDKLRNVDLGTIRSQMPDNIYLGLLKFKSTNLSLPAKIGIEKTLIVAPVSNTLPRVSRKISRKHNQSVVGNVEENENKVNENGENKAYFLRMNTFFPLSEIPGIQETSLLSSSILSFPFLEWKLAKNTGFGDIGVFEEEVKVELPKHVIDELKKKTSRETISEGSLPQVEYFHYGIRNGLEKIPVVLHYLNSKNYSERVREIFENSLKVMKRNDSKVVKLDGGENYRAFIDKCVVDLSFADKKPYSKLTLDVFGRSRANPKLVVSYLAVKSNLDNLLKDNSYQPVIISELSRVGFAYDFDIKNVNPKDFRRTDKLPRNIIF